MKSIRPWLLSATILGAVGGLAYWRIAAPAAAPYDMDDCQRAYARARNLFDTLAVDSRAFPGREANASRTCGALRGVGGASLPAFSLASGTIAQGAGVPVTGDLRLHEFRSQVFGNTRMLRVLVPDDYDASGNSERRYPVLYLNDGQNLFDSTTSVLNPMEWRVDETVRALVSAGRIPPVIVVGIDNAGRRGRFKEYFPYVDEYLSPPEPDPQGRRYPEFLVDEVIPFVERRYRVQREAAHRGLGGSSAGALAAMYAAATRPGVFGRLLIESPSIYVDSAHILRDAARTASWPELIYLGGGTNESGRPACDPATGGDPELARDLQRFERLLRQHGVDSSRIRTVVVPCALHHEAAWAARLPEALLFLFAARGRAR